MTTFHIIMVTSGVILWSLFEGIREAFYYDSKMRDVNASIKNEHWMFAMQRLIVFGAFSYHDEPVIQLIMMASFMLVFPFFHDGMYHQMRNWIDINKYPDGWTTDPDPDASNAVLDFPFWMRVLMLLCGVILFTLVFIV